MNRGLDMHIIETLYVVLSSIKTIKKGTVNMLIVVGGMIGLGKSSVAEVLGEALGSNVFYESVDDNPILPLFYTASPE